MLTWLATIIVAGQLLGPAESDCRLQPGAFFDADIESVAAISCNRRPGFFVPSAVYRDIRDPTKSSAYRLLEQELEISKRIEAELRQLDQFNEARLARATDDADRYRRMWMEADQRAADANQRAVEAAQRSWIEEPVLWLLIGIGAAVAAMAAAQ